MIGPEYDPDPADTAESNGNADRSGRYRVPALRPDFGYVTGTEVFVTGGQHLPANSVFRSASSQSSLPMVRSSVSSMWKD